MHTGTVVMHDPRSGRVAVAVDGAYLVVEAFRASGVQIGERVRVSGGDADAPIDMVSMDGHRIRGAVIARVATRQAATRRLMT